MAEDNLNIVIQGVVTSFKATQLKGEVKLQKQYVMNGVIRNLIIEVLDC